MIGGGGAAAQHHGGRHGDDAGLAGVRWHRRHVPSLSLAASHIQLQPIEVVETSAAIDVPAATSVSREYCFAG